MPSHKTMPKRHQTIKVFLGTFVSALLLCAGAGLLLLMVAPVLASVLTSNEYQPELPLAPDRSATEAFIDVNSLPARLLYPALTEATDTADGDWIRIPAIGVAVPLAESPSLSDADVLTTLDRGAALYPNGIRPGHLGNTFVSAHSTGEPWKGKYRFAFLKVNELQPGHEIHLDYRGARYTYKITHSRIVKPTADFTVRSDRPIPTVTLMACWPLWTTNQRMLVHGELTNITQLTSPPQI